jgi:AraC-like DNA-binding protein
MKPVEIRLLKEQNHSFVFLHEINPFSRWHYHPEFELVLINNGKGKRMVGDNIDRFENGDLVLIGANVPHEWLCDDIYFVPPKQFQGEGMVIQFLKNFLGEIFLEMPENKKLRKVLEDAAQGCLIKGKTKKRITETIIKMKDMDSQGQLYSLLTIFGLLSNSKEYQLLSSPKFTTNFQAENGGAMKKVIQFIMQNFQEKINMKKLLSIANMSSTAFSNLFKKTYNMTFTEYILKVRIGYACSLLSDNNKSISQISSEAGFENLSNFNRLFKKIKNSTPKDYRNKISESEKYADFF